VGTGFIGKTPGCTIAIGDRMPMAVESVAGTCEEVISKRHWHLPHTEAHGLEAVIDFGCAWQSGHEPPVVLAAVRFMDRHRAPGQ